MLKKISLAVVFSLVIITSSFADNVYPQIAISGYKKWIYDKIAVSPLSQYNNYFEYQRRYDYTSVPWNEPLTLGIDAVLSNDLYVKYFIQQDPRMRDYNELTLKYKGNLELTSSGYLSLFDENEFLLQDYVSGMSLSYKTGKIKAGILLSGKYPATYQGFPLSGISTFSNPDFNGKKTPEINHDEQEYELMGFDLGKLDVDSSSIKAILDGKKAYDISIYFRNGKVFVPQSLKALYRNIKFSYQRLDGNAEEKDFALREGKRQGFLVPFNRLINGQEVITVDGVKMERDLNYYINYNNGLIVMNNALLDNSDVQINYDYVYGSSNHNSENWTNKTGTSFSLSYRNVANVSVVKNGTLLVNGLNYQLNRTLGTITFLQALIATDTLQITYDYGGIRQTLWGGKVEYDLANWNIFELSLVNIQPDNNDSGLFDELTPSSYQIINLKNKLNIVDNSEIISEISSSSTNLDIRTGATVEAGTAIRVEGRTNLFGYGLSVAYRKIDPNFASIQMVKQNANHKETDLNFNLETPEFLKMKFSFGSNYVSSRDSIAQPALTDNSTHFGVNFKPTDFLDCNFSVEQRQADNLTPSGEVTTKGNLFITSVKIDNLTRLVPAFDRIASSSNIIYKYMTSDVNGYLISENGGSASKITDIGWKAEFFGGLSSYLSLRQEDLFGPAMNIPIYLKSKPFYRVGYKFNLAGQLIEVYGNYSSEKNSGSLAGLYAMDNLKNQTTYGLSWLIPSDNPILSAFQMKAEYLDTRYTDNLSATNNYQAQETTFAGEFDF